MSLTVQALIVRDDRILLVHERGDEKKAHGTLHALKTEKPPGWGMPGGGVDKTKEDLLKQISRFLPVYKLNEEKFLAMPYNPGVGIEIFLTLIKECIEETGLLVCPKRVLFIQKISSDHEVIVMGAEILDGEVKKRSIEIDDCDWFPLGQLPEGIYQSHRRRISHALRKQGGVL
jgi:8-oxo-dGTP pyrophosphatase MutT (NUDIX family)